MQNEQQGIKGVSSLHILKSRLFYQISSPKSLFAELTLPHPFDCLSV